MTFSVRQKKKKKKGNSEGKARKMWKSEEMK